MQFNYFWRVVEILFNGFICLALKLAVAVLYVVGISFEIWLKQ